MIQQYFPGDKVLNIKPHYSDDMFLIELNQIGIIELVTLTDVTVLWPYGVRTTVSLSAVTPYQSQSKR